MCRNIKKLRRPDGQPTEEEMRAAALQFVRKISGYRAPSKANERAFNDAIDDVTSASQKLFERLTTRNQMTTVC